MKFDNPVFCALDTPDAEKAGQLASAAGPYTGGFKIGMEFFYAHGKSGYQAVAAAGKPVFLDLKLHDIPVTVARAIKAVAPLQPAIINVHASGGRAMMEAAAEAASGSGMKVIAVSVLTSLDAGDLEEIGINSPVRDQVARLGLLAKDCGLDGMVCSAHEIETLRDACGRDFLLVVPGIRPEGADIGDQKRVMTPKLAIKKGADILVIGRPITAAPDPAIAAMNISNSL